MKTLPYFSFQGAQTAVSDGFVYSNGTLNKLDYPWVVLIGGVINLRLNNLKLITPPILTRQ